MMRKWLIVMAFGLLSGCSQLAQPPVVPLEIEPQAAAQLEHWSAEGRIGIRWSDDSQSANLNWEQEQEHYRIRLSGPLGQGGLRITGSDQGVSLQQSGEDEIHRAATPEALMQQLLGWNLPLTQARFWIRGIPAPDTRSLPLDDGSRGFTQAGWRIEYPRLMPALGTVLPEKLRLTRDDLRITLIINEWQGQPSH